MIYVYENVKKRNWELLSLQ